MLHTKIYMYQGSPEVIASARAIVGAKGLAAWIHPVNQLSIANIYTSEYFIKYELLKNIIIL